MPSTTAQSSSKAKKRPSPFRIKVGCVVALRYKPGTGNHVTMIVPPPAAPLESNNNNNNATTTTKPTKYPLRSLVGSNDHAEVWTDPIAGRDEGLALIGRRVRCVIAGYATTKSSNGATTESSSQAAKTTNFIVEGEIVSLLDLSSPEWSTQRDKNRRNRLESPPLGFAVELLVDRSTLTKVPFLERTDEDIDVDKMKKESTKRAYRNEEMIKGGKNKVTVKLWLEDPSGIASDPKATKKQRNPPVAKWAIRKRIPNQPGQPLENVKEEVGNNIGVHNNNDGSNGSSAAKEANNNNNTEEKEKNGNKSNKSTTNNNNAVPTQFMGNPDDDATQQQRNWRWLAARYFDMYLAATRKDDASSESTAKICSKNKIDFYSVYSNLLASCGGLVGEVLEVTPSTRAGTLAMVTIRRLILPEHTAAGRTSVCNKSPGLLEAFDDYDSTLIGNEKMDTRNGLDNTMLSSVVFRVPIEELVIVSRQLTRDFGNQGNGGTEGLYINSSYSLSADCQVLLKNMVKLDGETRVPTPLNTKKLKKLYLCHHCRIWLPKSSVTICENATCPLTRQLNLNRAEEAAWDDEKITVGWCKVCLEATRKIDSITSNTAATIGDQSLPCCTSSCSCRQCTSSVDRRQAKHNFVAAIDTIERKSNGGDGASDNNVQDAALLEAESTLKSLPLCHFDIPADFLPLDNLSQYSSKPIEKTKNRPTKNRGKTGGTGQKRKRDTSPTAKKNSRKSKGAAARCRSPSGFPLVHPHRVTWRKSEDYSVFKPTCCRLVEFKEFAAAKEARSDGFSEEPPALTGGPKAGERTRNYRELQEKDCGLITQKGNDEKTLTGRAARASQRRLVKAVAIFGGSSFNFDTLAGREAQLRFDRSTIHAWGVFADGEISAGDVIAEYRGELIGNAMAEKREREYELAKIGSDYMFRIDGLTVCDATKQGNVARFINASCDPNCYTKIITLDGKQRIVIYAKKDIKAGEELCYDYKFSLEYDESKRIPCHCGAQDCRGYMNWDKKLG